MTAKKTVEIDNHLPCKYNENFCCALKLMFEDLNQYENLNVIDSGRLEKYRDLVIKKVEDYEKTRNPIYRFFAWLASLILYGTTHRHGWYKDEIVKLIDNRPQEGRFCEKENPEEEIWNKRDRDSDRKWMAEVQKEQDEFEAELCSNIASSKRNEWLKQQGADLRKAREELMNEWNDFERSSNK